MNLNEGHIRAVPTNIITGFLGVGKTSAILHLLKHKPVEERWAVLVNEFGEIGVDGSLLKGQHTDLTGLHVDRMKAVFITDAGIFGYNITADALTEIELDDCLESRIEIISENLNDSLETQLLACVEV